MKRTRPKRCSHCGRLTKVVGRTYHCQEYRYRGRRDGVGANFLNKGMYMGRFAPGRFPSRITYRRPENIKA